jgi:predicted small secreted protein
MACNLLVTLSILQRVPKTTDRDKAISNIKNAISDAEQIRGSISD